MNVFKSFCLRHRFHVKCPLFDSQSDSELSFSYAIRFFWTFARLSPRSALRVNSMESFENRRRRFLWKDLISQRRYHAIPQQWFERPKKQKYFSCLKVCQRWCDERETRKISFMLWRCEKCGEFRLQQVEQSAQVFVFAEVTTTR